MTVHPGALLERAAQILEPLGERVVFVGGVTVHLHVDDPAAEPPRSTKDVDVIVEVSTYAELAQLGERLAAHGVLQLAGGDDGPICRYEHDETGLIFDVLPVDPSILGFSPSVWFERGFHNAQTHTLPSGRHILIFEPLHLLAVKIEAFKDRGVDDPYTSQDIQDIYVLLSGCTRVFTLLEQGGDLPAFILGWAASQEPDELIEWLACASGEYERAEHLVDRLHELAARLS